MYIKALEQEVLRLKEVFGNTVAERDAIAAENRRLKELLAAHGIHYDLSPGISNTVGSSFGGSSNSTYDMGTGSTGLSSPPSTKGRAQPLPPLNGEVGISEHPHQHPMQLQPHPTGTGLNYDELGIDFVLTYDRTRYLSPPP